MNPEEEQAFDREQDVSEHTVYISDKDDSMVYGMVNQLYLKKNVSAIPMVIAPNAIKRQQQNLRLQPNKDDFIIIAESGMTSYIAPNAFNL